MLVRLSPEQVVSYWERLRPLILQYMIPKVDIKEEAIFHILQGFISESIQLWAGLEAGEEPIEERLYGFLATTVDIDAISQTRNLLIYSMFAVRQVPDSLWLEGIEILSSYRKEIGCYQLIAYSDIPYVVTLAERLGFQSMSFLKRG